MSLTEKIPTRSSSQVLRGVFYRLFKQDDQGFADFDSFYESKMEKLIKHYKQLINKDDE
jgi:hypothetical protein